MPKLFNLDHQHAIVSDGTSVAPGESYDFTAAEIKAGVAGNWSPDDPRAGLAEEKRFKSRRDAESSQPVDPKPADAGSKES